MVHTDIEKKFPSFFANFAMPTGAGNEVYTVYRACVTNKIELESFIPSHAERSALRESNPSEPGSYSLSVYENPKDVRRFAKMNKLYGEPLMIAKGTTELCCGMAQKTRNRTNDKKDGSHIDWWLYEKALPHEHFELIEDFNVYYENYERGAL